VGLTTDLTGRTVRFFGHGGGVAWYLVGGMMALTALSTWLFVDTRVALRFRRDVMRMVAEDNVDLLEAVQANVQMGQRLIQEAADAEPPKDRPYLVVSLEENRLWLKGGSETLFTTQVATGSGKTLVQEGGSGTWKFDTPRGRLTVQSKEKDPVWQPPDWHFVEQARKRGLAVARLEHGEGIRTSDGGVIRAEGADMVKRYPDGRRAVLDADDGREIVADGRLIIPPLGTNQRRYKGVLGTHRLNLGSGYALHGTNQPNSIGRSVSHGCIRLRNEDIAKLYDIVPVGTPVYIY
jgi:L,D-transpeptidase-like protein